MPAIASTCLLTHALKAEGSGAEHNATETILRNARVIAMDQKLDFAPGDKPDVAKTATLELTAKQTEIVTLAVKMGDLSLVLRSLQDEDERDGEGNSDDATAELGQSYTHDTQVSRLIKEPAPPKPPEAAKPAVFVLRGASRTKHELDGSTSPDGLPPPAESEKPNAPKGTTVHPHLPECAAMIPSFAQTLPSAWRRAGSSAALAASLLFAFQPSLLLAQVQMNDPDRVQTKPKAPPPAKKASRKTATDNVSDDLNRREAERAEAVVRSLSAPAARRAVPRARARRCQARRHRASGEGHGCRAGRCPAADRRRHPAALADRQGRADARRRSRPARSRRAARGATGDRRAAAAGSAAAAVRPGADACARRRCRSSRRPPARPASRR